MQSLRLHLRLHPRPRNQICRRNKSFCSDWEAASGRLSSGFVRMVELLEGGSWQVTAQGRMEEAARSWGVRVSVSMEVKGSDTEL